MVILVICIVLFILPPLNLFCCCYVLVVSALLCAYLAWNFPVESLKFLNVSLVFPILLFFSICLHFSLKKAFLSFFAILWNSAFIRAYLSLFPLLLVSQLFVRVCQTPTLPNVCVCVCVCSCRPFHFALLNFFCLGTVWVTGSCKMSWISVYSYSGILSIRSNPLNLFLTSTIRGLI